MIPSQQIAEQVVAHLQQGQKMGRELFKSLVAGIVQELILHGPFTAEEIREERQAAAVARLGGMVPRADCLRCGGKGTLEVLDPAKGAFNTLPCGGCFQ